jgi:hypothetical protein
MTTGSQRLPRSESAEGKGRARRAWDAYAAAVNRARPRWVDEAIYELARRWTADLLGFWLAWHIYGGFAGLRRAGWAERTIYRRLKLFRLAFHKHPDEFELTGVTVNPIAFWQAYLRKTGTEG